MPRVAVMQPYFFPYIGYFQLVNSVDVFVFYDDVNYIKGGWINRNRILLNDDAQYITVQLRGGSSNRLIHDIAWSDNSSKLLRTLQVVYGKAPFFRDVFPLVDACFSTAGSSIADLAAASVEVVARYIGVTTRFERSSERYSETRGLGRAKRLIAISRDCGAHTYVNPTGGKLLYGKAEFAAEGVELRFLRPHIEYYPQFRCPFVPGLSIIDVLMFNSRERVQAMVEEHSLE